MFTLNDFIDLMKYFKDGTVGNLDPSIIIQAEDSKAKTTLIFNENIDLSCFSSNDYKRLKDFLIPWYASIRTFSSTMKNASDIRSLPEEHLNELIRSFGFVDGLDDIARTNKDDFFYSLVDLYKIKGTPESLLTVLGFFGIPDLEILEYWLQYNTSSELIFRPQLASLIPSKFNIKDLDYNTVVSDDPHWMLEESQINQLFLNNKIAFPSKSPYFGIRPITQLVGNIINPVLAILSRTIQDTYANYISGQTIPKDIKLSVNINASLLDLYMGVLYCFNTLYPKTTDSTDLSFLIYNGNDSTSLTNIEIIELFDNITKRSSTTSRDQLRPNRELYYNTFTRLRTTSFLTDIDTAGNLLTTINNELKVLIDYYNSNGNLKNVLKSLLKDLSIWIKSNISSASSDLIILLFGFLELDYIHKVINFFKPYRARLIPIEQVYTIDVPVLDLVITEDDYREVITDTVVDFDTGDSIGSCCPPDEIPCLDSTATIYYTRNTFDCGSEFDIGASVDPNDFTYIRQEDDIIYNYHDGDATACIDTEFSGDEYFALQSGGFVNFDYGGLYDAPQISDICKVAESAQSFLLKGYIDELRLSTGVGRYDDSFTPETSEYTVGGTDSYTKLLLHMNGTDGSTTFTDSSSSAHTVTPQGTAQIDTAQYKWTSSGLFDGNSDYLTIPDSDDWYFDGDFTIDCWVRYNSFPSSYRYTIYNQVQDANNLTYFGLYRHPGTGDLHWHYFMANAGSNDSFMSSARSLNTGQWYHIAIVKNGTTHTIYENGINVGSQVITTSYINYNSIVEIGRNNDSTEYHDGWIDELRISKGIARYTTDFVPQTIEYDVHSVYVDYFTPETSEYTTGGTDSYTKLMLHMNGVDGSPIFVDSSLSSNIVTTHGNAQIDSEYYKWNQSGLFDDSGGGIQTTNFTGMGDSTTFDLGLSPQRIGSYLTRGKEFSGDPSDSYFYVLSGGGYVKASESLVPETYHTNFTANTSYAAQTILYTTVTETGSWWSAGGTYKQYVYVQELRIGGPSGTLLDTATYTERWEWTNVAPTTEHACTVTISGTRFANSYNFTNTGVNGNYKDASNYLVWVSKIDITTSFTLDDRLSRSTIIGSFSWVWTYKIYDNSGNIDVGTCSMSGDVNQYGSMDGGLPFVYYFYAAEVSDATLMMPKAVTLNQSGASYRILSSSIQQELYKIITYQKATYTWDCSDVMPAIATRSGDTSYVYANGGGSSENYLSIPNSNDFNFGVEDFTIDFWVRITDAPGSGEYYTVISMFKDTAPFSGWRVLINENLKIVMSGSVDAVIGTVGSITLNTWTHVAIIQYNDICNIYLGGIKHGSGTINLVDSTVEVKVGATNTTELDWFFPGWIDELRISKGIARWFDYNVSGGIDSYTTLLLHGNGLNDGTIILDSSPSAKAITRYNVVTKTGTKKFGSASLYFNGDGSYLTLLDDDSWYFGSNDFTLDFWIYLVELPTNGNYNFILSQSNENDKYYYMAFKNINGSYYFDAVFRNNGITVASLSNSITISTETWYHFAIERYNDFLYMFQDGIKLSNTYDVTGIEMPNITELLYVGGIKTTIISYMVTEDGDFIIDF